jgi:glycosyltransferase involved in cell wall biosynthesis
VTNGESGSGQEHRREDTSYVVVHVVSQESHKEIIRTQVLDHMQSQLDAGGDGPKRIVVGLLEPARVAISPAWRRRVRSLRTRAPGVTVRALPYVSRAGIRPNSWWIGRALRRELGDVRVVFHARSEMAGEWALELRRAFTRSAVVLDSRGPWAEDLVFARGFDDPADADPRTVQDHHLALGRLQLVLARAGAVLTVSAGMMEWLGSLGVAPDRLTYVPCCVRDITFDARTRSAVRERMGWQDKIVVAAVIGDFTRYQHAEDGIIPFVEEMASLDPRVHLLCLCSDPDPLRKLLARSTLAARSTVQAVPQEEVAGYLSAADAGLLLKRPSRLNRFAQPIKLGEFLAAGLPTIVSRGIGQVDRMLEEAGAGIVVDCFDVNQAALRAEAARTLAAICERRDCLHDAALRLCERSFLWRTYTEQVRNAYQRAFAWPA